MAKMLLVVNLMIGSPRLFLDPSGVPQFHQAIGIVPATLINCFLNSYWTFKE
jgi:hypothetical protein